MSTIFTRKMYQHSVDQIVQGVGDAFGRVRTSSPYGLFGSKQLHGAQTLYWDDQEVSGGGTSSTHSSNRASSMLAVAATTAGVRTRQTYQSFSYQAGKSQIIMMTGVLDASGGGTGIKRYIGQMNNSNGIYFVDDEGTVKIGWRTFVSGAAVDNETAQSNWSIDPMDGTGPSKLTVDWSKAQIFAFDYEWLGVGRIRWGLVLDGKVWYVHEYTAANRIASVHISNPNLPLRYSIENDGTGAASQLECICAAVFSESGQEETGVSRAYTSNLLTLSSTSTYYALLGIRLSTANVGEIVKLVRVALASTTANDEFEWQLRWNPTVAGVFTYNSFSDVDVAVGAATNTVTGGTILDAGYIVSQSVADVIPNSTLRLGNAIDGTLDEIVLCARPLAGAGDIEGILGWIEHG